MSRSIVAKYVAPWRFRREQAEQRLAELRKRDGDDCRRCRRPMRFDLPAGHDKGPKIEATVTGTTGGTGAGGGAEPLETLCLCHGRCNSAGEDHTDEVAERIRRKSEAALLSTARRKRRA
jgi:hypothetical protein